MNAPNTHIWFAAGLLVLLSGLGACNCNGSASSASEHDLEAAAQQADAAESSGSASEESSGESAPSKDLYPEMDFGQLEVEDRKTFVSLAKSELCPCSQTTESLHKCLQDSGPCTRAKRSATIIARGLESGLSKQDIRDNVAQFVEKSEKQHDFNLESVPHKGPEDAPVRVIEFADFQCPHCRKASEMMKELLEEYDGKVVHYFKHFPLSGHGKARVAARAAWAAHQQGKFWPMHDLIFEHQRSLTEAKFDQFARRLGLNFQKFKKDMHSDEAKAMVKRDRQGAKNAGIKGTPAIFVNGREYMGQVTKQGVKEMIESELSKKESE